MTRDSRFATRFSRIVARVSRFIARISRLYNTRLACMQGLSAYIIKFDNIERSNQGHLIFSWLFFINEACYDKSLLETHIGSHIIIIMISRFTSRSLNLYKIQRLN